MFNLKFNIFKQAHYQKWNWHFYAPTILLKNLIELFANKTKVDKFRLNH